MVSTGTPLPEYANVQGAVPVKLMSIGVSPQMVSALIIVAEGGVATPTMYVPLAIPLGQVLLVTLVKT